MILPDDRPGGDAPPPGLSILIPTYNRPTCLRFLIARLMQQIDGAQLGRTIEIVVSDNASPQPIDAIVETWRDQGRPIRTVCPPEHFASAEENLLFGLRACRGDFVWAIGDDDIPMAGAVEKVLALIEGEAADFFLLNSVQINTSGEIIEARQCKFDADVRGLTITDLAQLFGFTTILASFSSVVLRRRAMMAIDLDGYLAVSPIYAHVAAYMEAFAGREAMFVAEPQIMLREGTSLDSFKLFAETRREATYAPWIKGLFRLRKHLLSRRLIDSDLFLHTIEVDKIGRFRTFARLLAVLGQQLELWIDEVIAGGEAQQAVSAAEFVDFADALAGAPQWVLEVLLSFEEVRDAIEAVADDRHQDRAETLTTARRRVAAAMRFEGRIRVGADAVPDGMEEHEGYRIGRFGKDHIAVPIGLPLPNRAIIDLTRHDLGPPDARVILSPTAAALREAIATRAREDVPATAGDYRLFQQADRVLAIHNDLWRRWGGEFPFPGWSGPAMPPLSLAAPTLVRLLPQVRLHSRAPGAREEDMAARLAWLVTPGWYRREHPEVEDGIDDPTAACVRHILEHEASDPRPTPLIDFDLYRRSLAQAVTAPRSFARSLLRSLVMEGLGSALPFSPLFDERWYCTTYDDAAALMLDGRISCGFQHYLTLGRATRASPGPYFDEAFYLKRHHDASEACARGDVRTGAEHYLWRGADLGYAPSPNFTERGYLDVNDDVAAAVSAGHLRSGFLHWLTNGRFEGRSINVSGEITGIRAQPPVSG